MVRKWYVYRWLENVQMYPYHAGRGIPGYHMDKGWAFWNLPKRLIGMLYEKGVVK